MAAAQASAHPAPRKRKFRNFKNRPISERFWEKVERRGDDDCWLWQSALDPHGYGCFSREGRRVFAHRLAFELAHGDPGGMNVLHRCDTPACVNPRHLFLGTQQTNVADMVTKRRHPVGSQRVAAKLNETDVQQIFELAAMGTSQREIAEMFGVCQQQISCVLTRRTWKHVEPA